jgi:hypothetical protein
MVGRRRRRPDDRLTFPRGGYPSAVDDEPTTQELRALQDTRVSEERRRAREAEESADERTHERRADKADYLREKLAERERAERRAAEQDRDDD